MPSSNLTMFFLTLFLNLISCLSQNRTFEENLDITAAEQKKLDEPPKLIEQEDEKNLQESVISWKDLFEPDKNSNKKMERFEHNTRREVSHNEVYQLIEKAEYNAALELIGQGSKQDIDILILKTFCLTQMNDIGLAFSELSNIKKMIQEDERTDSNLILRYRYILATTYLKSNRIDTGKNILANIIQNHKQFIPAYFSLASLYINKKKIQTAEFIIKRGLDQVADAPSLLVLLGVVRFEQGETHEAKILFKKALHLDENNLYALIELGYLELSKSDFQLAEGYFKKTISVESRNIKANLGLALIELKKGFFQKSRVILEKLIEEHPEQAQARFYLAEIYWVYLNKPNIALRLFTEAQQLSSKNFDPLNQAAEDYIAEIKLSKTIPNKDSALQ